ARSLHVNDRDDFSSTTVLASDQSKRRGQIIRASLLPPDEHAETSPSESAPMLIGWLADEMPRSGLVHPRIAKVASEKSMVLVRSPLRIEPPAAGANILVPSALVTMDTGRLPYDIQKG